MPDHPAARGAHRTRRAKGAFFLGATAAIVLLSVEAGARLIAAMQLALAGKNVNPYVEITNRADVFERASEGGRPVYHRTADHPWIPGNQTFEAEKSARTLRIFLLGGSAANGWPHDGSLGIGPLLAHKLRAALPETNVEVLVGAGVTFASYRVKVVFDEIIDYAPDLVIIYCGNNEFLEDFVLRSPLGFPWRHSAAVRISHDGLTELLRRKPVFDIKNYGNADHVANRLAFAFGRASKLRDDPEQFRQLRDHYRYNIQSMVDECRRRGVPVMLLQVPVNLKDWVPNVSVHRRDLTAEQLRGWQRAFREGYLSLEQGEHGQAAGHLRQAVEFDGDHAETHYYLAVALHRLNQVGEARRHYASALELDAYPFRALPEFNSILREISQRSGAISVDIVAALEEQAVDRIIGLDVLVDYVHPTVASNEVIAHELLLAMARAKLLPAAPSRPLEELRFTVQRAAGETVPALSALCKQHLIMRQYDKFDGLARRYARALERDSQENPSRRDQNAAELRRLVRIEHVVSQYRRLLLAEKLGRLGEEFSAAEARRVFDEYVEMIRSLEQHHMARPEEFASRIPKFQYPASP